MQAMPAAPAEPYDLGREVTMQAMPAAPAEPYDLGREVTMQAIPTAPAESFDLGREVTMQAMPAAPAEPYDLGREVTMQAMPAAPAESFNLGREVTMQAMPAAKPLFPGMAPVTISDLGRERTLQTMPAGPVAGGDDLGREVTMQAMPAAGQDNASPASEVLLGREQTMPATPVPPSGAPASDRTTPLGERATPRTLPIAAGVTPVTALGSGTKPRPGGASQATPATFAGMAPAARNREAPASSSGFDAGWHMRGRKGPHTGEIWGDWEIGGLLGEGGMGAVYRARQRSLKRRVALKVLASNLAADFRLRQRFELEARMTSMLSSPNVVQVFAAGEWEGKYFFAMEFIEGTDLYDIIKERTADGKPFTPDEAADIIIQAGKGLAEAGRHNMVHRDIKPPNLMVTKQGLVKVADFGIVKVMGESALTMTGQAVGTPSYVSPEQGRGDADIDQRSDIYSLGVVFYELLCGRKPFDGTTPNALIYQHCFDEPPLPRSLNPAISEEYQAVAMRCLQKKPENRYQSADELVKDLEGIRNGILLMSALANYRLGTGADEAKRENMSWSQRHLLPLVGALVAVILIAGGGGLWWYQNASEAASRREAKARDIASLRTYLQDLDQVASLPTLATPKLDELAQLLPEGEGNQDMVRWRAKLATVATLADRLAGLDAKVVPADLRRSAKTDLAQYQAQVGTTDVAAARWAAKLVQAQRDEYDLRAKLGELDTTDLTLTRRTALGPLLEQLTPMVPKDDAQVLKWTALISEFDRQVTTHVAALTPLDKLDTLNEREALAFTEQLTAARRLLGEQDPRVIRWNGKLTTAIGLVGNLRTALGARLNPVVRPPLALQDAVEADLETFRTLVDPKNPDLIRWDTQIRSAKAAYERLAKRLKAVDELPTDRLPAVAITDALSQALGDYKSLARPGDPDQLRWQARLDAIASQTRELVARNARLAGTEAITVADLALIEEAQSQLVAAGALSAEDGKNAAAQLAQRRERIATLSKPLQGLDRAEPLPEGAATAIDELVRLIGRDDPAIQRWRAKLAKTAELTAALAPLETTMCLDPQAHAEAHAQLTNLIALVSTADLATAKAAARLAILDGPGRPTWAADAGRDRFGLWADLQVGESRQRLRFIPAGAYIRGSPDNEPGRKPDETQLGITLTKSFWLAEDECTQQRWEAVMKTNPSRNRGQELPVNRVSWTDVSSFLSELTALTPERPAWRLPTESEWEYACRAGRSAAFSSSDLPDTDADKVAWFADNARGACHEVRLRLANGLGLFDLQGNVWEWCQDTYGPYSTALTVDPLSRTGDLRVIRGGSWGNPAADCRAANRSGLGADIRSAYVGFRLALDATPTGSQNGPDNHPGVPADPDLEAGIPATDPASVATTIPEPR